jgi:Fe-S cluster assembly protein SufD
MPESTPEEPRKAGSAREATLNYALDGVGTPRMPLADSRGLARESYDRLELPRWRRSGFWTTSLQDLELDTLEIHAHGPEASVPAFLRDRPSAGVLVQRDASVVHIQLDPELARRGVILCSLEDAAREHTELFERYYLRRLRVDRHKLEAASAAFWTGGAFLYVPSGLQVADPFQIVYEISQGGSAQYAHTLAIAGAGSDLRLREYGLAGDTDGDSLHAGQFELYLEDGARCRLAQVVDWGAGPVHDVSTSSVLVPLASGAARRRAAPPP